MMATFRFVFRPSTLAGRPGSLALRVVHGRKPKTVSISRRLFPEEWDTATQNILYPADDRERTEYLKGIEAYMMSCAKKTDAIIQKLESQGPYTAKDVIERYRKASDENKLTGYAAKLSEELAERGQYRTAKAYGTVCRGLVSFNNGTDIPLTGINALLIRSYETYMKENGKQPNTISYYMRNLRAIYNKAIGAGHISKDEKPFAKVFTGVEESRKRALTATEVSRIKNADLTRLMKKHHSQTRKHRQVRNLDRARRLFLFCLYAHGMSFVDMCYLRKSQFKNGVIRYYRKKTGRQIEVPVNDGMLRIIRSFEQEVKDSEFLFPLLTDGGNLWLQYETALRTQNRRLKEIAVLAGLDEGIATHVARHSWASILKSKMQPLSVISEGLGHTSEKMTRKYLASFDRFVLAKAGKTVLTAISRKSGSPAVY